MCSFPISICWSSREKMANSYHVETNPTSVHLAAELRLLSKGDITTTCSRTHNEKLITNCQTYLIYRRLDFTRFVLGELFL